MRKLAFGLSFLILAVVFVFISKLNSDVERQYQPRTETEEVFEQTVAGAAQWLSDRRRNLETGVVNYKYIDRARMQIAELRQQKGGLNLQWEYMGPDNVGGRCRAILIHPDNPDVMYAGGVSGGLWKTESAGGSWRQIIYEGDEETDGIPNLNISNICRTVNGDIYFGTGESFYVGYGTGTRGFEGAGIWKSTDGKHFERLPSTWSTSESKSTFVYVSKLAAHPTEPDVVFAATYRGLRVTYDGGETWENPVMSVAGVPATGFADDIKTCPKGEIMITRIAGRIYVSHEGGGHNTWEEVSGGEDYQIPNAPTTARVEFAIAPTNSNYIYAQASRRNGQLLNVYRSRDGGYTWDIIGPGGSADFNPLGDQGIFNNTIKVFPDNHNEIILGGQFAIWTWSDKEGWKKRSMWNYPKTSPLYVHADQHEIRFHPENPNIIFVGSDGGVSRSLDRGRTWQNRNKFFGITQFYAIGFGPRGSIIGGTQDNGTLYWDAFQPPTQGLNYEYSEVAGGDGGKSEISQLNPDFLFATIYYGNLMRSELRGEPGSMVPFYNSLVYQHVSVGSQEDGHPFITPIALWESFYDENSIDSTFYTPPFEIEKGVTINIESNVSGRFYEHTLEETIDENDTIWIKDTYQSLLAVGFRGSVWVANNPMNLREETNWLPVYMFEDSESTYEVVQHMEWSSDGNILYVAVNNIGNNALVGTSFYRIKGFNEYREDKQRNYLCVSLPELDCEESYSLQVDRIASFQGRVITGIAVDPEFSGNVVLTLGNYGASQFVYHSTTANVAPAVSFGQSGTFVSKQGNLPQMPVYDALILWNDSRKVIVGTEFGVYSTLDITADNPVWFCENKTFDYVATYNIRQQYHRNGWVSEISADSGVRNHGHIWAGTHGRGIFRTTQFEGPANLEPPTTTKIHDDKKIGVFPSPATDIINLDILLDQASNANITIYDLQGRTIESIDYHNLSDGQNIKQHNISEYNAGMYIVQMTVGNNVYTTRFVVE